MYFNPSPVRRVPSPNRYMAVARFCFCKNNKRTIDRCVRDHDAQSLSVRPGRVCLLLQDLLQSCACGGRRIVEDMCYEIRRA
jgi:hypothetical protein